MGKDSKRKTDISANGVHTNSPEGMTHQTKFDKAREKERVALEHFKKRIGDIIRPEDDDFMLRKWLKARSFDVNKAEQMYRNSMTFRKQMNADKLLDEYVPPEAMDYRKKMRLDHIIEEFEEPEVLKKYLTGGFCGHDKDGSPVRVELYGHLDMKGLMSSVRKSDLEKTKLLQCEWTVKEWERQGKKLGRRVDGLTVIFDMEGVSTRMLWRPGLQMYLHMVRILEDNYPEMMKRLLVINAPRIFPLLYKLCRPLISDDMKNKIHVIAGDYQNILLKYIDAENLPAFLGGKSTDPDGNPRCTTMISQGGDVPEQYFLDNEELYAHMSIATVPRGDKIYIDFNVEQPGSILRWEFKTEDYDIGFGVLYKENNKNVPVVPVARVNSHVVAEDGSITCDKAGLYMLCFDNTFSWTRSKKIHYVGEIIPTDHLVTSEVNDLIDNGDWDTLERQFETTHL